MVDMLSLALSGIRLSSQLLAQLQLADDLHFSIAPFDTTRDLSPFHYLVSGSARIAVGQEMIDIQAGEIVMLPNWHPHTLITGKGSRHGSMHEEVAAQRVPFWARNEPVQQIVRTTVGDGPIRAYFISGLWHFEDRHTLKIMDELPNLVHLSPKSGMLPEMLQIIRTFTETEKDLLPGCGAATARLLEWLVVETLRQWAISHDHVPGRLPGALEPTISRAMHAIHACPERSWTIDELARIAGRSRSSFNSVFRAMVGSSPARYLTEYKFDLAAKMLRNMEPVARVADKLGYGSAFAFSRAFRASRGISPAQLRKQPSQARIAPSDVRSVVKLGFTDTVSGVPNHG